MPLSGGGQLADDFIHANKYVWKAYHGTGLVWEPIEFQLVQLNNSSSTLGLALLDIPSIARRQINAISKNGGTELSSALMLVGDVQQMLNINGANGLYFRSHSPVPALIASLKIEGGDYGITSITSSSISRFTGLTRLHIKGQSNLSSINLASNTLLQYLEVDNNSLSSLNISTLTNLISLKANNNNIPSLNLASNPQLQFLEVDYNNISTIDLSSSPNLVWCLVGGNGLSSIDLSNNPDISWLRVIDNNLTALDISYCTGLTRLEAKNNNISSLSFTNTPLIEVLDIGNNNLSTLNTSNLSNLEILFASQNTISSVNFTNNTDIVAIQISENNLSTLDISMLSNLGSLDCTKNASLATLDISNNNNLTDLRCSECDFTADDANPSIIDAIIIKMNQNIVSGGTLHYDTLELGGVQPTAASLSAYNSLVSKGCNLQGKVPA